MIPFSRRFRANIAAALVAVVTALSVAVPLLDRGRDAGALAFMEPGSTTGYVDHHHAVCLQYSATTWSPVAVVDLPSARLIHEDDAPHSATQREVSAVRSLPLSRAPPLV